MDRSTRPGDNEWLDLTVGGCGLRLVDHEKGLDGAGKLEVLSGDTGITRGAHINPTGCRFALCTFGDSLT